MWTLFTKILGNYYLCEGVFTNQAVKAKGGAVYAPTSREFGEALFCPGIKLVPTHIL